MLWIIILSCIFLWISIFFAHAESFLFNSWESLSPDEIIYHLKTPLAGTDNTLIIKFFISYGVYSLLVLLLLLFLAVTLMKEKRERRAFVSLNLLLAFFMIGTAFFDAEQRSNIVTYAVDTLSGKSSAFISSNYVEPKDVSLEFPEEKRNVIFIFLESMECTYSDKDNGGWFPNNLIPELTELSLDNYDFGDKKTINGHYSLPGTNWTSAGMYAALSGLPIKTSFDGNDFLAANGFFPNITCLGDVLSDNGYKNYLLLGSDASFGARRELFTNHGNYTIHDYNYMNENNRLPAKDYKVFWGYEDGLLFSFAKEELLEIAGKGEPFNYNFLTVDTHFEDGYVCEYCQNEFDDQYSNVMACSSRQISDFVNWVKNQDFYENTTIVIAGDHTTMDVDFCADVPADYKRKCYFSIINPESSLKENVKREFSSFDIFPTTLSAMGVKIEGERLGLGTNLFSDEETIIEKYGLKEVERSLSMPSDFYTKDESQSEEDLYYDMLSKMLYPELLEYNGEMYINFVEMNHVFTVNTILTGKLQIKDESGRESKIPLEKIVWKDSSPHGFYIAAKISDPGKVIKKDNVYTLCLSVDGGPEREMIEFLYDGESFVKQ